ncbi:ATP-binding cassette domain-containing protein [Phocicoccus pinnipedialis]|uniref:Putative ABC transporter ATP-binding protein n=1 Tax=Phocicoccus pinnipedialis TaxID=110845 RepID=A0A6V7R0N7_9BACL|nr:ATP-binding cassette domain-containing protein [Jeotgalicoccus pinnipedialis]MBP1938750.1 ATP-binding cassette subfamily C protein CydC [Jeotgalicoccus pinnipedialis]CAD2070634.1 putative ABC transporter ATP-binding protein [Jeotgalicoccus pinnipedialis]
MTFFKNERSRVLLSIVLGIIGGLVGISIFGLSGYMISLSYFEPPLFIIILIIVVIKLFGMAKGVFRYFERLFSHEATFELINSLRKNYFKDSIHSEEETNHEWFVSRLNTHFERIEDYYIRIIYPFMTTALIAIILTLLAFIVNIKLVLIMVVFTLITLIVIPFLFQNKFKVLDEENNTKLDQLYMAMYHLIHGFTDLYVSNRIKDKKHDTLEMFKDLNEIERKRMKTESIMVFVTQVFQIVAIVTIILSLEHTHALYLPMLVLLFLNFAEIVFPILRPAAEYKNVKASLTEVEKKPSDMQIMTEKIVLENHSFRYEGSKRDALYGVNFKVAPGEKHVIIGPSGSGKTTLLNQLLRTKSASVMPQFLDFYNATIHENVTMFGANDATEKEVNALLEEYKLSAVKSDTHMYYTHHMSTGEQKRLQIIRMLLEDKNIWILDEPTAGLSAELSKKVWDTVMSQETVIVATHDLSHLEAFDFIHYIENGRVLETLKVEEAMKPDTHIYEAVQNFNELIQTLE